MGGARHRERERAIGGVRQKDERERGREGEQCIDRHEDFRVISQCKPMIKAPAVPSEKHKTHLRCINSCLSADNSVFRNPSEIRERNVIMSEAI